MEWFLSAAKWIVGKLQGKTSSELKEMQEYYQSRIKFLKEDLAEQQKIINQYKQEKPGNGQELEEWIQREEKLGQELIKAWREIKELKGQLIFHEKMKK